MTQKLNLFLVGAALVLLTGCGGSAGLLDGDPPYVGGDDDPPATTLSGGTQLGSTQFRPGVLRPTVQVAEPGSVSLAATGLLTLAGLMGVRLRKNK